MLHRAVRAAAPAGPFLRGPNPPGLTTGSSFRSSAATPPRALFLAARRRGRRRPHSVGLSHPNVNHSSGQPPEALAWVPLNAPYPAPGPKPLVAGHRPIHLLGQKGCRSGGCEDICGFYWSQCYAAPAHSLGSSRVRLVLTSVFQLPQDGTPPCGEPRL